MNEYLISAFSGLGLTDRFSGILTKIVIIVGILIIAFLANLIAKKYSREQMIAEFAKRKIQRKTI